MAGLCPPLRVGRSRAGQRRRGAARMIPLAKDTREAIGAFASKVENRSLLFQKMVLSKTWGHEARFNDANRFNVLRACSSGGKLLGEDRDAAALKAGRGG